MRARGRQILDGIDDTPALATERATGKSLPPALSRRSQVCRSIRQMSVIGDHRLLSTKRTMDKTTIRLHSSLTAVD
jgi:hypothetical protein